ncbi:MAG: M48 family metallopeptidase [Gammaproteobacteria bacterium]|nr:M48 family metallopeptidase [Gammaproteobacteria bacterium]
MLCHKIARLLFILPLGMTPCLLASKLPAINILNPIIKIQRPSDVIVPNIPSDTEDNLPDFGDVSESTLSSYQEQQMGKAFMGYVRSHLPIVHDAIVNEYLNNLGYRLVAASPRPSQHYHFFVINQKEINAFSGPDGYVGVYAGLILETKSEGELAAVLAHEIAHVSQHHIEQMVAEAKRTQLTSLGALAAAIAIGIANPLAGIGAASVSSAGTYQHMINFTRYHEKEADRIGIQLLAKSGFDPRNMPRFFKRMQRYSEINSEDIPEILQTHPVTEERLADAYNRCEQYPKYPQKPNLIFPFIQARVAANLAHDPEDSLRHIEQQLQQPHLALQKRMLLGYAYTLTLLRTQKFNQANAQIQKLITLNPHQLLFQMSQVDILIASQHYQEALYKAQTLYHENPDSYPIIMQYATVLLRLKQFTQARKLLEDHKNVYDKNIAYLDLLSQAQGFSGEKSQAYETRAQMCLLYGDTACAREQLQMALQFSKDTYTKERIKVKLQRFPS